MSGRIMIVELDPFIRDRRVAVLRRAGYSTAAVTTTEEAAREARREPFDLLVVGGQPPRHLAALRDAAPLQTGIIVIAEASALLHSLEFAGTGVRAFLAEPCSPARLRQTAARTLEAVQQLKECIRSRDLSALRLACTFPTPGTETDCFFIRLIEVAAEEGRADFVWLSMKGVSVDRRKTCFRSGTCLPAWERIHSEVAELGKTVVIEESAHDKYGLHDLMMRAGISALLSVPLEVDGEAVGSLTCARKSGEQPFTATDIDFASILARWSALVLSNAGLYRQSQDYYEHVQRLLEEVSAAQDNERRRLAAEIHDGVAQSLVAASYGMRACSALLSEGDLDGLERHLTETRQTVQRGIKELRRAIAGLRPVQLDEVGLVDSVRQAAGALAEDGIACCTEVDEDLPRLSSAEETTTYRIIQEMLTNVRRHSGATAVTVRIHHQNGVYSVEITDNGRGFDVAEVMKDERAGKHMGLVGMKERAELLSGSLTVRARPGSGTRMRFTFPVSTRQTLEAPATTRD